MGAHLITIARPTHHRVVAIAHKLYFEKRRRLKKGAHYQALVFRLCL